MMALIIEGVVIAACALVVVLAIAVIGAMHRTGSWGAFTGWTLLALGACVVGVQWRDLPSPVALLLLALALLLWRQRGRIVWAVQHGRPW